MKRVYHNLSHHFTVTAVIMYYNMPTIEIMKLLTSMQRLLFVKKLGVLIVVIILTLFIAQKIGSKKINRNIRLQELKKAH